MAGDTDIAPVNAWDNGSFTFFKFSGNRDMPAIFMVDADGKESIVGRHGEGKAKNIIAAHKVNKKWMLRLGNRALAIFNEHSDRPQDTNESGTRARQVERVIRGGN